jgi:hypothetical protein
MATLRKKPGNESQRSPVWHTQLPVKLSSVKNLHLEGITVQVTLCALPHAMGQQGQDVTSLKIIPA